AIVLIAALAELVVLWPAHVVPPALVLVLYNLALFVSLSGFGIVQPNQARVVTLFGRYLGSIRRNGWIWTWPLTHKQVVSLRVRNFESSVIKVNDAAGNPVEIAAVIVWQVVDTARAVFSVEKYEEFVRVQTETAVRHVASLFPYDSYQPEERSLRANPDDVMKSLHQNLQGHLEPPPLDAPPT